VSSCFWRLGNRGHSFRGHETFSFSLLVNRAKNSIFADVSSYLMLIKLTWHSIKTSLRRRYIMVLNLTSWSCCYFVDAPTYGPDGQTWDDDRFVHKCHISMSKQPLHLYMYSFIIGRRYIKVSIEERHAWWRDAVMHASSMVAQDKHISCPAQLLRAVKRAHGLEQHGLPPCFLMPCWVRPV